MYLFINDMVLLYTQELRTLVKNHVLIYKGYEEQEVIKGSIAYPETMQC